MDPNQKKVTKEDYLRKKGLLPAEPLGSMFVFKSSREGVEEIKEILIWKITTMKNGRTSHDINTGERKVTDLTYYKFNEAPYDASLSSDEIVSEHRGCGSGFGDLWAWSWFSSLNKSALIEARKKEIKRIVEKYGVNTEQTKFEFPVG